MLDFMIIVIFAVLRIGIPAAVLLTIGEAIKRHNQNIGNLRGA
jgi:hypothetical protein